MTRIRHLAGILLALSLGNHALPTQAAEAGLDYLELSSPRPTEAKGKVEIIEFFWYGCPHCYRLEPELQAWIKKLPKDVTVRRMPATLNDSWEPMTRAYYAMEALGLTDKLHAKLFEAIHANGLNPGKPEVFFDWAAKQGVDKAKLAQAYNSFSVNAQVMHSRQLVQEYKLTGVPAFAVAGRYVTSAYMTGSNPALFDTLDALIQGERKRAARK